MSTHPFESLQVVLVEPSHTQQTIIKHHLESLGIVDIICLNSGGKTMLALATTQPDLVVSAMYLPDMTGDELVHHIRTDNSSYNMAFLLISSETKIEYLEPIRQAGAIAILPKPFSNQELKVALLATVDFLQPEKIHLDHFDIEDVSVLLVDDSPLSLKYITRILNDIGIENIILAKDGQQALKLIDNHFFDLIVTDYNMPEMDGLQLTEHIRCNSDQKTIPILMVTSEQNINRLTAVKQAGVSAMLDKPFEISSIRNIIITLLN